jgi:hypothetical protein
MTQNREMSSCVQRIQIYEGSKPFLFYIILNSGELSAISQDNSRGKKVSVYKTLCSRPDLFWGGRDC